MNEIVSLKEKFTLFDQYWTAKVVGQLDDFYVKVFKAKGEFVWHSHQNEDEFFLVIKGSLKIKLPDREVVLNEGEFFIIPKGVGHCPYADQEAHIMLLEKKDVINTGKVPPEKTAKDLEWI